MNSKQMRLIGSKSVASHLDISRIDNLDDTCFDFERTHLKFLNLFGTREISPAKRGDLTRTGVVIVEDK